MDELLELDGVVELDDALNRFRKQWKDEIRDQSPNRLPEQTKRHKEALQKNIYLNAKELFERGVWAEQNGIMHEAIEYYRQATKMVPDIEMKIEQDRCLLQNQAGVCKEDHSPSGGEEEIADLCAHFAKTLSGLSQTIEMERPQRATHFVNLPTEIVMSILRWVISSDLDTQSLERLSMVCKRFYLLARDASLWEKICSRVWGVGCKSFQPYCSWREMFIENPHPLYSGVYFNKVEFLRQGEATIDKFYPPWQKVVYYRYLRFFSDGHMIMHTSAASPISIVSQLQSRSANLEGMCKGIYRIHGDKLSCILRRVKRKEPKSTFKRRRKGPEPKEPETTFLFDLSILSSKRQCSDILQWEDYTCTMYYPDTKTESTSKINLTKQDFPPCHYAHVKSYMSEITMPL